MNTEDFKNQIGVLGDMWGTPHRGLFTDIPNKWDIDIYQNGLKEEIIKLQSKSVPINEIFLKPNLIGKNYLIYKDRYLRGKCWKGCLVLDLSYLIGDLGFIFRNWNSNALEGEK